MVTTKLRRRSLTPAFGSAFAPEMDMLPSRFRQLFDDPMARLLSEPFAADFLPQTLGWYPAVEVAETNDEFVFIAELPGLTKDNVDVQFEQGVLTITGEKQDERTNGDRRYHVWERTYGSFRRSFAIPSPVNEEKLTAEMNDGILRVHLPKAEESKVKSRKIDIIAEKK